MSGNRAPAIAALTLVLGAAGILGAPGAAQETRETRRLVPPSGGPGGGEAVVAGYAGSYALVVGMSDYRAGTGWKDLESVPDEVERVVGALRAQGFEVVRHLDPDGEALERAFRQFIDEYGYEPRHRLLFYVAGHGHTLDDGNRGYLVPTDAPNPLRDAPGFRRKALSMVQILAWAREMTAKHALFLFDSCFSGTIFKTRTLPDAPPHIDELTAKAVRQFITAGSANEEVPARSAFTPAFVDALEHRRGDLDGDGYVTGTELGLHLEAKVPRHANQTPQYGKIRDYELSRGDFVFRVGRRAPEPGPEVKTPVDVTGRPGVVRPPVDVTGLLEECEAHFASSRLTTGLAGNAAECWGRVLKQDPGNTRALDGLKRIEETFAGRAEDALGRREYERVRFYVKELRKVSPDHPWVWEVEKRIEEHDAERARARRARVEALVGEVEAAARRGELDEAKRRLEELRKLEADHPRLAGLAEWIARAEREKEKREAELRAEEERRRREADDAAFARAKGLHTASGYEGYLSSRPEGRHAREARALLEEVSKSTLKVGDKFRDCAGCPEMVVVPSGSFRMGSPPSEVGRENQEGPVHRVTISRAFAVGVYEVTFGEWDSCVRGGGCGGYRPSDLGWGRGSRPVINVSWDDAKGYVRWLSRETGEAYRLLSESEWEYVARAGTTTPFHTGRTISPSQANYDGRYTYGSGRAGQYRQKTTPVGLFSPNAFGLYDVHGNVQEWVEDCSNGSSYGYHGVPSDGGAQTTGNCYGHIVRDGNWGYPPEGLRSAYREFYSTDYRGDFIGFRVARTLTP